MRFVAQPVPAGVSGHPFWHLLAIALAAIAVFGGLKFGEWWRAWGVAGSVGSARLARRRPWARPSSPLAVGVALASIGCSATHAAGGPVHFREATAYGVFFVAAAGLQAVWALLVLRRVDRLLLLVGAAANSALLLLWAVTRTVGLPVGPDRWRPEALGKPDLLAALLEVTIVLGAWLLLRPAPSSRTRHRLA